MKITHKLLLLVILPFLAFLAEKSLSIREYQHIEEEEAKTAQLVKVSTQISALVHATQKERAVSTLFLSAKGEKFSSKLMNLSSQTNQKKAAVLKHWEMLTAISPKDKGEIKYCRKFP